jgi:MFS family permease
MAGLLKPVTALLLSTAILLMGNGLAVVLLPIRAVGDQFTRIDIGILGSSYFAGLMIGCFLCPAIIKRVGHIRAFTAFTAIVTITPLLHAISAEPPVWWGLRALNGLCFAGLYMVIESWLNAVSDTGTRGRIFASYTMINLTVVTLGMQFMVLGTPMSFELFSLAAILYSLAAVPIALTRTTAPAPPARAQLPLLWLIRVSPAAMAGALLSGLAHSAFWTLSPLYGQAVGLSDGGIATFMTVAVLSGAVTQWPFGQLSDRIGRRPVAALTAALGATAAFALSLMPQVGDTSLVLLVFAGLFGAMAFPTYALCVAHANDLVKRKRAVIVSGGLLMTFSLGAVMGPLIASALMAQFGNRALFLHAAVAQALIVVVLVIRARRRPTLPDQNVEDYVMVARTTPAVFDFDPRAEQVQEPNPEHAQPDDANREPEPAAAS